MNNVIVFPKGKKNTPPQTISEIINHVEEVRKEQISLIVDSLMSSVVQTIYEEGFDISNPKCVIPIAYMAENMKAIMCASLDIDHPINEEAQKYFDKDLQEE